MLTAGRWTPVHRHKTLGDGTTNLQREKIGGGGQKFGGFNRQPASNRFPQKRKNFRFFDLRVNRIAWVGGVGALSPTRVLGYAMRTYSGRPSSSIRFSTLAAIATSVACRPSVCDRSPLPMTRFRREISASTRARQPYPDARCQPMRPPSAIHRRCPVALRFGVISATAARHRIRAR